MVSEASRGRTYLLRLHSELGTLLNRATRCVMVVVDLEVSMDELS